MSTDTNTNLTIILTQDIVGVNRTFAIFCIWIVQRFMISILTCFSQNGNQILFQEMNDVALTTHSFFFQILPWFHFHFLPGDTIWCTSGGITCNKENLSSCKISSAVDFSLASFFRFACLCCFFCFIITAFSSGVFLCFLL